MTEVAGETERWPRAWRLEGPAAESAAFVTRSAVDASGRRASLRRPRRALEGDPFVRRLLEREAAAIALVNDLCTVQALDVERLDDGTPVLVLERLPGITLRDRLKAAAPLDLAEAREVALGVLAALSRAHAAGVVHRNVKPEAVRLVAARRGPRVVLDRFAVALLPGESFGPGPRGGFLGTPDYASPEQCMGDEPLDARSDVYSAGVVLFEMLTGQVPFASPDAPRTLARHMVEPPRSLAEAWPLGRFPRALERAVATALEKRPEDRYATAGDFAAALRT